MSSTLKKYADALERIVWTTVEAAGAVGLIAGYQALPVADIPDGWIPLLGVVLTVLIAAGKNVIATNVGNGSSSTLPVTLEPVPAEATQEELPDGVGMPIEPVDPRDLDGDGRDDKTGRFV